MTLGDIAHGRAGDKGRRINVSVIAYDPVDYPRIVRQATCERVQAQLADLVIGDVVRYELPQLGALNFVFTRRDLGGVTRTLALDAHGKSISSALMSMEIDDENPGRPTD